MPSSFSNLLGEKTESQMKKKNILIFFKPKWIVRLREVRGMNAAGVQVRSTENILGPTTRLFRTNAPIYLM